jgi:CheY-like chemotaxis protein
MSTLPPAPRLLLVEHDPSLCEFLEALLREEGYAVVTASSLPQALALSQDQVFNGIFTALFPGGQEDPLASIERLRVLTRPTPIGLLSRFFVSEAEAARRGYAAVLELPFRMQDVLRVLETRLNPQPSPEHAQRAHLIHRLLDALGRGEWDLVRPLCLPTVRYSTLTPSLFATAKALVGVEDYLAHAQSVRQHFPGLSLDHAVVFEQQGLLGARFCFSWRGQAEQRLSMAGSVICQFAGERISRISVSLNWNRLRALLAETATE